MRVRGSDLDITVDLALLNARVPSPWAAVRAQVLLGSEQFVEKMRPILEGKAEFKDIPRAQRLAHRPDLKRLFPARVQADKRRRDEAIRTARLEYGYSLAAIARHADAPYSTVSKIVKGER